MMPHLSYNFYVLYSCTSRKYGSPKDYSNSFESWYWVDFCNRLQYLVNLYHWILLFLIILLKVSLTLGVCYSFCCWRNEIYKFVIRKPYVLLHCQLVNFVYRFWEIYSSDGLALMRFKSTWMSNNLMCWYRMGDKLLISSPYVSPVCLHTDLD